MLVVVIREDLYRIVGAGGCRSSTGTRRWRRRIVLAIAELNDGLVHFVAGLFRAAPRESTNQQAKAEAGLSRSLAAARSSSEAGGRPSPRQAHDRLHGFQSVYCRPPHVGPADAHLARPRHATAAGTRVHPLHISNIDSIHIYSRTRPATPHAKRGLHVTRVCMAMAEPCAITSARSSHSRSMWLRGHARLAT